MARSSGSSRWARRTAHSPARSGVRISAAVRNPTLTPPSFARRPQSGEPPAKRTNAEARHDDPDRASHERQGRRDRDEDQADHQRAQRVAPQVASRPEQRLAEGDGDHDLGRVEAQEVEPQDNERER